MTATQLLADLGRRGIRLALTGGGLQYEAPRGALTATDREAIAAHRGEILEQLHRVEAEDPVPAGPCTLCGSPLAWIDGWPTAGEARWLCPHCAAWPAPSLAEVFAALTAAERRRLDTEVSDGGTLARTVLAVLRAERGAS